MLLISFIFVPAFPLGRGAGAAALGGLGIPHGQQEFQIILSSWICLASLSWGIMDTEPNQYICALSIQRRKGPLSGLCEFHSCALCRKVSQYGIFAKIPSLALAPEISFRSLPKIQDHR